MMRVRRAACLLLLVLLPSCAWARRENRPVWTAFEDNLVPQSSTGFAVALPVTVPLGLLAILVDTFVAHPLQVVDEAFDDSAELWRGIEFEQAYYTEAGIVPLRAVATPVWFAASFLGRSMFDIRTPEQVEVDQTERVAKRREETLSWLRRIAAGEEPAGSWSSAAFDEEMRLALAAALAGGTALGRIEVYQQAARAADELVDWGTALADPSAVVRFRVLQVLPGKTELSAAVLQRLRDDPDEAVRSLVARRFAQ